MKLEVQAATEVAEQRLNERMQRELQARMQEWEQEKQALVRARQAAEEAAKAPPSKAQMQELVREPLSRLLQLLYFSEVSAGSVV